MALVRVTVQLRDSLPAEILLYVTSRSKLLDVLGGMGLEVEDDLEVRARVAGTDGMLIWCDEKIGEVDGVSQYTVAGTSAHSHQVQLSRSSCSTSPCAAFRSLPASFMVLTPSVIGLHEER